MASILPREREICMAVGFREKGNMQLVESGEAIVCEEFTQ